ncbi:hypothetical protein Tco_0690804 [Tanacetum coccineum]
MKFFKRRGRFVRQPLDDKKSFQRNQDGKNRKAKENALDAEIRITLSENVRNHQETKTEWLLLVGLGVIAVRKTNDDISSMDDYTLDSEYHNLFENEKLKEEASRLTQFEKSTHSLKEMLSSQIPSGDKSGLWYYSFEASTNGTKQVKFVKSQETDVTGDGSIKYTDSPIKIKGSPDHVSAEKNQFRL